MKKIIYIIIISIWLTGCGSGSSGGTKEYLANVMIIPESSTFMHIGDSQKLTAMATFIKGPNVRTEDVSLATKWSTDELFFNVTNTGVITCQPNPELEPGFEDRMVVFGAYQDQVESLSISCYNPK